MNVIVCAPILRNNNDLIRIAHKTRPKQSFVVPVRCRPSIERSLLLFFIYLSAVYLLQFYFFFTDLSCDRKV